MHTVRPAPNRCWTCRYYHPRAGSITHGATVDQIKGKGGIEGVSRLLRGHEAWRTFTTSGSKQAEKYNHLLAAMLEHLHRDWEYGFEPEVISENVRLNNYDEKGLERAKASILQPVESHIDEEVLTHGHSGEKHYGKDAKYQEQRMEREGKERVTTIEDTADTRKFITTVRLGIRDDLLRLLHEIISEVAESPVRPPTRASVKAITDGYVGSEQTFKTYRLILETIPVVANANHTVTITFMPKLESLEEFPKTEYTAAGSEKTTAPIVMYWGSNSPKVIVEQADDYTTLYDKLTEAIVAPVTAF